MADIIFPSGFEHIGEIALEDILLINDKSLTDAGGETNFVASIEQIVNFLNTISSTFKGIAHPDTKYEREYKEEYYIAYEKGNYTFIDQNGRNLVLNGQAITLITNEGKDYWTATEILNVSNLADKDEVNKQISALQPENYLQKNAMQDEELTTFDFGTITQEDNQRYFRTYNNDTSVAERLSFSLVKGALQTYVKQQMALYPTFTDMYNAIGSIMGGGSTDSLAKQVSQLQNEMQQLAVPFSKQDQVQIKYTFNHVPKCLIMDSKGYEVVASVEYNTAEKYLIVHLNPDEIAEGIIYVS